MICKITNLLQIFFQPKKIRKIRYILKMKKFVKFEFSIYGSSHIGESGMMSQNLGISRFFLISRFS